VVNDPGGEVTSYLRKYNAMRTSGERLVIDGPCLSACTLFTGIIPHDHVCVTRRAVLGFNAASYFDDARHTLVPNRQGTQVLLRLYPPEIRDWIDRHGGLKPEYMALRGESLSPLQRLSGRAAGQLVRLPARLIDSGLCFWQNEPKLNNATEPYLPHPP